MDNGWRRAVNAEEEVGRRSIHGGDPREQGGEAGGDDGEELPTMQRVKRVANVKSGINPGGVGLKESGNGMGKER